MEQSFSGRVALVTGGSSGIGRGAALELARLGARVAVLSFDADRNTETVAEIEAAGGAALPIAADVTRPDELADAVALIDREWGRLDHVVISAGKNGVFAPLDQLTLAEWNDTLATNLTSTFLTTQAALPLLRRAGGSIVIISSVNGNRTFRFPGAVAYSTSKAGQVTFAKMVAVELAQYGIRINVVCPGAVRTNIGEATHPRDLERITWPVEFPRGAYPLGGRQAEPTQIARVITFLLSDAADYVTGTEVYADAATSLIHG